MKKETEKMAPAEGNPTEVEKELEALRQDLACERIKTAALARRCILLAKDLGAAQTEVNKYADGEVIDLVNGKYYHLQALMAAKKLRRVQEEKAVAAYEKACKRNAIGLGFAAVIGFIAMLLGFTGFIHFVVAAIISGASMLAFGWLLNDCVYLLGRCE